MLRSGERNQKTITKLKAKFHCLGYTNIRETCLKRSSQRMYYVNQLFILKLNFQKNKLVGAKPRYFDKFILYSLFYLS